MPIVKLVLSILLALVLIYDAPFDYFGVQRDMFAAMIQAKLPDTEYARRAGQWMTTKQPLPARRTACVGCHLGRR